MSRPVRHLGDLLARAWRAYRYLRLLPAAVLLAVVLSGRPATAAAQSRIQVTPYFVTHIPILNHNRVIGDGKYIGDFKQTIAPGLGGKLTWWTSREFAAEVDVNYVLSGTRVKPASLSAGLRAFADDGHQLNATVSRCTAQSAATCWWDSAPDTCIGVARPGAAN